MVNIRKGVDDAANAVVDENNVVDVEPEVVPNEE